MSDVAAGVTAPPIGSPTTTDQDSSASSARRAPLADAVQPVAHETRDRIITGLAHRGPLPDAGLRRLAARGQLAALERPRRLRAALHPDRARDHGRLPPTLHPPQLQDRAAVRAVLAAPRLGGDRGAGDLLGRRPPQAPRLLRRGGRSPQPPRRPRRGRLRPVQGLLPRPPGLALHPHPARLQGALRAGPAEGSRSSASSTAPSCSGRWSALRSPPSARLGDRRHASMAGVTGLLWGGAVRIFVLHHVTYSINSLCHMFGKRDFETDRRVAQPRLARARRPSARPGTTTTTPSRPRPSTG